MGAINKNNAEERKKWGNFYIENARKYQIAPIIWDNGAFDNNESLESVYGLIHRDSLIWVNEDLVKIYTNADNIKIPDNFEECFPSNYIEAPVTFIDWDYKIYLYSSVFTSFNSYCKLCFTTTDPPTTPSCRSLEMSYADWSSYVIISSTDLLVQQVVVKVH